MILYISYVDPTGNVTNNMNFMVKKLWQVIAFQWPRCKMVQASEEHSTKRTVKWDRGVQSLTPLTKVGEWKDAKMICLCTISGMQGRINI